MSSFYVGGFAIGQKIAELESRMDASSESVIQGRVEALEAKSNDRIKYVYPNDGAEGLEKELALDTVYFSVSPFESGAIFSTRTEYFSETLNEWVDYERVIYSGGSWGVVSSPRCAKNLIAVTTGNSALSAHHYNAATWEQGVRDSSLNNSKWRVRCVRED